MGKNFNSNTENKNNVKEEKEFQPKYINLLKMISLKKKNLKNKRLIKNKIVYSYYIKNLGLSLKNELKNIYEEHFLISLRQFNFLNNLKPFIRNKRKKKKNMPIIKDHLKKENLKTIVFDLDETLIHSNFEKIGKKYEIMNYGKKSDIYIKIRPHLKTILNYLYKYYELILFTASQKDYADFILNIIDPNDKYFSYKFYRNDCIMINKDIYIKDLNFLDRNFKKLILVDNSSLSFGNFLKNSVPIIPFFNNKFDNELINLKKFIKEIFSHNDVRIFLNKYFKLKKIINFHDEKECFKKLYFDYNKINN